MLLRLKISCFVDPKFSLNLLKFHLKLNNCFFKCNDNNVLDNLTNFWYPTAGGYGMATPKGDATQALRR